MQLTWQRLSKPSEVEGGDRTILTIPFVQLQYAAKLQALRHLIIFSHLHFHLAIEQRLNKTKQICVWS
jgi:hypothetical protein